MNEIASLALGFIVGLVLGVLAGIRIMEILRKRE